MGRCGWGWCKQADLPGSLFSWEGWGIISTMKRPALKVRKATVSKAQKGSLPESAAMRRKVKQTFAAQVDGFIDRYRPALEALAKR